MKTTLVYYTNNIAPRNLLRRTLSEAVEASIRNEADLVITSHFPLTENYEYVNLSSEAEKAFLKFVLQEKRSGSSIG